MSSRGRRAAELVHAATMFVVVAVLMGLLAGGLVVPFAAMAGAGSRSAVDAMELLPAELETPPQPERSRVLMSDGTVLATFYEQNRVYVPLEDIAPVMRHAQVAIEDHRFYEHGAIDVKGTLRALLRNSAGGSTQGGSSITQQYVKMVQVEKARASGDEAAVAAAQEKSYSRKLQELRYALAVEEQLSKDEILERYLNIAYFGDGAYGVEQAARQFFGTSAAELDLAQAAMLAGLVQNPTATDPRRFPDAAVERRDVVLDRMVELGLVSAQAADEAGAQEWDPAGIRTAPNGCVGTRFPFLCDYVRRTLLTDEALGRTEAEREVLLERGGLTIRTRIEPETQEAAEEAISDLVDPRDPVIATMTMVEPGTGQVLAMAQSRPEMGTGAGQTYYNYAVPARLGGAEGFQAGSTFKAFTAAAALEQGISVQQRYDSPSRMDFSGQSFESCDGLQTVPQGYRPKNSTRSGPDMTMGYAMAWSVNTYFLQLGRDAGLCNVTSVTERLGVELSSGEELSTQSSVFSLPLGSVDITPLSMTEAYATFAADGVHCEPVVVEGITSRDGTELDTGGDDCDRVIERDVSRAVTGLLSEVMDGTGRPAQPPLPHPVAGKTGATDNSQAAWFCGFSPEVAGCASIAVDKADEHWDDRRRSLTGLRLSGGTVLSGDGSADAGARIWRPAMTEVLADRPATPLPPSPSAQGQAAEQVVPQVLGLDVDRARARLSEAGFSVVTRPVRSSRPEGEVLRATPSRWAPAGGTITLTVATSRHTGSGSSDREGTTGGR